MLKKLLSVIFILFGFLSFAQNISTNDFIGLWEYDYSLDSINGHWSSYLENSSSIVESVNTMFSDSIPAESFQQDFIYPLVVLDRKYTLRLAPLKDDLLKVNFLEYPEGQNSQFTYIDRTDGYTRAELIINNEDSTLNFFNDSKRQNYKLISFDKESFVLLDESQNIKHIFKRK